MRCRPAISDAELMAEAGEGKQARHPRYLTGEREILLMHYT